MGGEREKEEGDEEPSHELIACNTKSQRVVLPSLLRAVAGESSLFRGSSNTTVLWVLEHAGGAPCPPTPALAVGRRMRCTGLGKEVRGWDVCECLGVCVHRFWQEVVEVT